MLRVVALSCLVAISSGTLVAQVSITATGSYTQDFNTLISTGSGTWADNSTLANWYAQRTGTGTSIAADAGGASGGNLYSYGPASNSDRALGSLGSGNAAAGNFAWGVLLRNNSGVTVTDLTVAFTGEQWRNSAAAAQTVTFHYKINSSPITALNPNNNGTWTAVSSLNFTSPVTGGSAGALAGNSAANRTEISATVIPSLSLAPGDYIMLKWDDPDHSGSDHGLSVDDVTIAWTVPPTGPNTSVQFTSASATVSEGVGTVDLTLSITDEDAVEDTEVDVVLISGSAGRIDNYTTQTVTFTGGSSANETLTITVTDSSLCDGDAFLTFALQNVTGGQGTATIGAQDEFELEITDNDLCTSVQFVSASSSVAENAGTTDIALSITNFDEFEATEVTISASGATGRISSFTTPVVFAANSGSNENCTVTLANNILCDGDEDVVLTITGISGGQGTAFIGTNNTHTLTIQNEDVCTGVSFAVTSATIGEGVGTYDVVVNITDPSPSVATSVDVLLADGNGARIDGFSTQTVTFPANTSTPQTVTLTVTDDMLCNGTAVLTFELQDLTGGQNTAFIGPNGSRTLTITDNDEAIAPVAIAASDVGMDEFTANWNAVSGATGYFLDVYTIAGVEDDFTDGDFTDNPTWGGSTGSYAVLTDGTVPDGAATTDGHFLASNANVGNAGLHTASDQVSEWRFSWASPNFSPSNANHFGVVLMASAPWTSIADDFNGYYLRIGADSPTLDYIELWRSTGGTKARVGTFNTPNFSSALTNGINVRVTRSPSGQFELFYGSGFTFSTAPSTNGGTITDTTYSTSSYFGVYTAFANAAATRRIYLDNVDLRGIQYVLEDESVGNVTTYGVSGLDVETTYHYVVRAEVGGGCGLSPNSNEIEVTTLASTSVQFSTASGTVAENAGTYNVTVAISDFSATEATSVDVVLTDGDGARIDDFESQTVTFPAGNGTPQTVTLTITDDALCNGNEELTFELQNLTGGQGTPFIGTNATRTLTVTDDEVPAPPPAIAASGETFNAFTANWEEVTGATGYFLDVSTSPTFGTFTTGSTTTETFTAVGGGTSSSYLTRAWTGVDGVSWTAYQARTDREIHSSNPAITLNEVAGAYLISGDIAGGVRSIGFEVQQQFTGSGGVLTVKVLSGPGFTTETTIGTIAYTTSIGTFSQAFADIAGPIRIRIDNNAAARPAIDNLVFARANVSEPSFVLGYEDLSVGNVLTFDVTGLDPETTYYYRVRSTGGCSTGGNSNTIEANTTPLPIYYSRDNGSVGDLIWAVTPDGTPGAATFDSFTRMVVQTGHTVTIDASTSINDLTLEAGATLTVDTERLLSVYGTTVQLAGTITHTSGEIGLVGSAATTLDLTGTVQVNDLTIDNAAGVTATGNLDVHGTLALAAGTFDATDATVRLRSTATRTGRLGPVDASASYTGNLNVERYIPPGGTNWRLLGSPVQDRTVADWTDDFFTAGFPGSHWPEFYDTWNGGYAPGASLWPSVRWYNEEITGTNINAGLVGVGSAAHALAQGQGFAVWCGDTLGTTQAFTVDVIGEPTIAHSGITLPMSHTNTSTPAVDGWNLVSNPLPSPISFAAISRGADVQNGYYVYDPATGSTAYWDGSLGTSTPEDALNGIIQSSQAFWLKASGSAVTTMVDEQDKVADNAGGLFGGDGDPIIPMVRLTMRGSTGNWSDQAAILFQDGTPALDGGDALKIDFSHPSAPRIATRTTDGHDLIMNRFGQHTSAISIPVTVRVPANGTYTITTTMAGLQGLSCFTLVDLVTGTTTPLTDGAVYSFTMNGTANIVSDRFVLHGTAPVLYSVADALCGGTATGSVAVQLTEATELLTLGDAFGDPLQQASNVPVGEYIFSGLEAGNYTVSVGSASPCGTLSAPVVIMEPFAIEASIDAMPSTCGSEADGSAVITILGGEAPYTILWNTGSTEESITGVAGAYTAVVTDAAGCSLNVEATIPAGPGPDALFETTAEPILVNEPLEFVNLSTPDAIEYTWDFGDGTTSADFNATHTYALPGVYTVTLTVSDGVCSAMYTQEVTVQLTTSVPEPINPVDLVNAWVAGDQLVVEHGFDHGRAVYIAVLDATGKLHIQEQVNGIPGRVQLPAHTLSTGIWFVRVTSDQVQRTIRVPVLR